MKKLTGKKVIIIGAGFGGLATACYLAKEGYQVTVVEKNEGPGGRARVWKSKGFTYDMGPSWYLMPEVFDTFFSHFDKKTSDYYELKQLDPMYRIYFADNDYIDIHKDLQKNIELFDSIEPGAGKKLVEYLKIAKHQYEVGVSKFVYRNYDSVFDFLTPEIAKTGAGMKIFESLDHYAKRYFKSDRLQKILQYTTVFLGGSPKNTPAMYSLMSHCDFNVGVAYPMGGIYKLVEAMTTLGKELGVKYIYNTDVQKILVKDAKTIGIKTKNKTIPADIVVVNGDYQWADTKLLPAEYQEYSEKYWNKKTIAPSGFILYLGINKKIPNLAHHTLSFAHDWMKHFDQVFDDPKWPEQPSYYMCCPSKTDPSIAPSHGENLFILVPVASGLTHTQKQKEAYAKKILTHMQKTIGSNFEKNIVVKRIYTPTDFSIDYHAFKGTALGLAHTFFQTAVFRPKNKSSKVQNLYYVGHYTVPGVGVPMVVISALLVKDRITADQK